MPATIFSGAKVKTLKDILTLNDGADIIQSSTDPQSSAIDAPLGSLLLNTTNGNLYRKLDSGSSTNWEIVGSGGSGGVLTEYIENGKAEANTTGWTAYANTSAGVAPDDFGGSASGNFTIARQTSSPSRGLAHFEFAKTATDEQGEGFYYQFSLENGDLANMLRISMEAKEISGTYADGDVRIYLVSSSDSFSADFNVIEPAPTELLSTSFWLKQVFEAQADATDTDYRLCIHVASTSATAYTIGLDSVSCGSAARNYGVPVTDGTSFGTVSNLATNIQAQGGYWWRQGDRIKIQSSIEFSGANTEGVVNPALPSGLSVDTSKIFNSFTVSNGDRSVVGTWYITDDSTAANNASGDLVYDQTAGTLVLAQDGSATGVDTSANDPITIADGDTISWDFEIPITGWSSNTQVSSDADTRRIGVLANDNGGEAITANVTDITWSTEEEDTHSAWDGDTFTAPLSGVYSIKGMIDITSATASTFRAWIDGSADNYLKGEPSSTARHAIMGEVKLNKGQALTIRSTAGMTLLSDTNQHWLSIQRISGPAQIAASEVVAARYSTSNTDTMTSGANEVIMYDTKSYDTHNAVSFTNFGAQDWVFTAPVAGYYTVTARVGLASSGAWTAGEFCILELQKNGSSVSQELMEMQASGTVFINMSIEDTIQLDKGDTLNVEMNQQSGSNINLDGASNRNIVAIQKVGGVG